MPPVILVHGFWDKSSIFNEMAAYLRSQNRVVFADLNLTPNNGKLCIEKLAEQLEAYISRNVPPNQEIDIVGFSMGGIVARYYIQKMKGHLQTRKLITIASPHQGTWTAYLFNYLACRQMRPKSDFIKSLNQDFSAFEKVDFTSIWAKFDTTILPNSSSHLPFGKEVVLPFGIHPLLPRTKKVFLAVEKALSE